MISETNRIRARASRRRRRDRGTAVPRRRSRGDVVPAASAATCVPRMLHVLPDWLQLTPPR